MTDVLEGYDSSKGLPTICSERNSFQYVNVVTTANVKVHLCPPFVGRIVDHATERRPYFQVVRLSCLEVVEDAMCCIGAFEPEDNATQFIYICNYAVRVEQDDADLKTFDNRLEPAVFVVPSDEFITKYALGQCVGARSSLTARLNLLRRSVMASERKIELGDIYELLAGQPAKGCGSVGLQNLFDLIVNLLGIALGVRGPLGRDAIQLVLGILQDDMQIQTGARSGHHICRYVFQRRVGMLLTPHIEEDRLDI
jgi:hypothetical protein